MNTVTDCPDCMAERRNRLLPCPHEARRTVERYGREEYTRGLRVGFDACLDILGALQTKGSWRRHVLAIARARLGGIVSSLGEVDYQQSGTWKAEARKACDGGPE